MTLRLILTRHAKSDWSAAAAGDRDRPLNPRGRRAAARLGAWLAGRDLRPETVLSSDAARTRETWALMAAELDGKAREIWSAELYLAGPGTMLRQLRAKGRGSPLVMLGHNPGIALFAQAMVAAPPQHPRFADYPTGATLVADFAAAAWADVAPGTGTVRDFVVPRDLD